MVNCSVANRTPSLRSKWFFQQDMQFFFHKSGIIKMLCFPIQHTNLYSKHVWKCHEFKMRIWKHFENQWEWEFPTRPSFFVVITIYNGTVFQDALMYYVPLFISDSFSLICFHKSYFKKNSVLELCPFLLWKEGEILLTDWFIASRHSSDGLHCLCTTSQSKIFFFLILKSETGKISVWIEIKIVFLESVFPHFDTHAYCIPLQLSSILCTWIVVVVVTH